MTSSPAPGGQPTDEVPLSRRSTELWMMLFACGIVLFAFLNVVGSLKDQHLSTVFEYMVAFLVIVLGAHLAVRLWAPYADPLLLPIATALNGLGIVMIYRLNQVGRDGNPSNGGPISTLRADATTTQILYSVIGVVALALFLKFVKDIRALQPYTYILGLAGLFLIALPAMLPNSLSEVSGTSAKIQVSVGSVSFQPEEFGKMLLAASFASYLVVNGKKLSLLTEKWWIFSLPRRRDLAPILAVWALSMLLMVFEGDIGTSAVFMGLFVAMLHIATGRRSWAVLGFLLFTAGAVAAGTQRNEPPDHERQLGAVALRCLVNPMCVGSSVRGGWDWCQHEPRRPAVLTYRP